VLRNTPANAPNCLRGDRTGDRTRPHVSHVLHRARGHYDDEIVADDTTGEGNPDVREDEQKGVVIVNGAEVDGWLDDRLPCEFCGFKTLVYVERMTSMRVRDADVGRKRSLLALARITRPVPTSPSRNPSARSTNPRWLALVDHTQWQHVPRAPTRRSPLLDPTKSSVTLILFAHDPPRLVGGPERRHLLPGAGRERHQHPLPLC
jgi:hypothetical protein